MQEIQGDSETAHGWFLHQVTVTDNDGEIWAFPCNSWIGDSDADGYAGEISRLYLLIVASSLSVLVVHLLILVLHLLSSMMIFFFFQAFGLSLQYLILFPPVSWQVVSIRFHHEQLLQFMQKLLLPICASS